ncbi:MAG: DUF6498-containing protein [Sulfurimonadaceae bacterium]|nr:DUF6498-containing protein [Sulfurimonadaceae bacterium]
MNALKPLLDPLILFLLFVNLIPLYGVLEWEWGVFELIFIFWFENVIIGLMTAFKMVMTRPSEPVLWFGKLFAVPFFAFHYGMFTFVHGIFVLVLFGGDRFENLNPEHFELSVYRFITSSEGMGWMVLMLSLSNMLLMYREYFGNDRYKSTTINEVMTEPYKRVVVLHLTVLFGGFLVMALNEPFFGLLLLVVLKITFDIRNAQKERELQDEQLEEPGAATASK